jgi:serine/threonine protein kinase
MFGRRASKSIDEEQLQAIMTLPTNGGLEERLKARLSWSNEDIRMFVAFLEAMLQVSPEERASASQLLCHPFLESGPHTLRDDGGNGDLPLAWKDQDYTTP